jgi:hypothetical protein
MGLIISQKKNKKMIKLKEDSIHDGTIEFLVKMRSYKIDDSRVFIFKEKH